MSEQTLWKQRFQSFQKEIARYGKYIFNQHLMIVMIFLIGGGGFYYQQWLATLSNDFPVALVMSILLMFLLTSGSIFTLLKEADMVFLLPLEEKLKKYFLKAFFFSYSLHVYLILVGFAILFPLYQHGFHQSGLNGILVCLLLLLVKLWNMALVWECSYATNGIVRLQDKCIRYLMNFLFVYVLLQELHLFTGFIVVLMIAYLYIRYQQSQQKGIHWEYFIQTEERRWAFFYRIANMFVDVPHMKVQIKRRKWLDFLLTRISFSKENTYRYLYIRTFLRSGDYLGLYIRLLVIGSIAIFMVPNDYVAGIMALVFLYLIAFQLVSLFDHHQYMLWTSLYPVEEKQKNEVFRSLFRGLLYVASAFLGIVVLLVTMNILVAVGTLIIGGIFSYLFKMKNKK